MMYAVLPVDVCSKNLSGSDFRVLVALIAHKGKNDDAWPSVSRIAEITGMAQNNVSRALSSLEKSGMIAREKTGTRNRYTFPCLDHTAQHLDMVAPVIAESATTATDDNLSHVAKTEELPAKTEELPAKTEELPAKTEELLPVAVHETPESNPQAALQVIDAPQTAAVQGELLPAPAKRKRSNVVAVQGELLPMETKKRATRLPEDWQLPRKWGEWAMEELGFTEDEVRYHADKFRDHWVSTTRNPAKKDWPATWRNWMRGENEKKQRYNNRPQQKSKTLQIIESFAKKYNGDFNIPF